MGAQTHRSRQRRSGEHTTPLRGRDDNAPTTIGRVGADLRQPFVLQAPEKLPQGGRVPVEVAPQIADRHRRALGDDPQHGELGACDAPVLYQ